MKRDSESAFCSKCLHSRVMHSEGDGKCVECTRRGGKCERKERKK